MRQRQDGWARSELGRKNHVIKGALLRAVDTEKRVQGSEAAGEVAVAIVNLMGHDETIAGGSLEREHVAARREVLRSLANRLDILPVVESLYEEPNAPGEARVFRPSEELAGDIETTAAHAAILSSVHGGPVHVEFPDTREFMTIPKGGSSFLNYAIHQFRKMREKAAERGPGPA